MSEISSSPPGVIFDLDGTLLDTLDDITASLNHALHTLSRPTCSRDQVRRMVGEGLPALVVQALGMDDGQLVDKLLTEYSRHHETHYRDHTRPYAGVSEMLNDLNAAHHPLAILSNKQERFSKKVVAELLSNWAFVAVWGPTDQRPRKPDPAGALDIARQMDRSPTNIFFVGDSGTDIATARAANMRSIAVTWGFRDREELVAANPDFIADRPMEVLRIIMST